MLSLNSGPQATVHEQGGRNIIAGSKLSAAPSGVLWGLAAELHSRRPTRVRRIDGVAFVITGDPEYYYAKHHSVHGYKPSPK